MKTEVVTVCSRIPDRGREPYYRPDLFFASLERFGVKPTVLGLNEWWGGLMTKPRRLRQWLRSGACKADTLIVSDAFDVIFARHPEEVVTLAWPMGTSSGVNETVFFNAERGLFPRGDLAPHFQNYAKMYAGNSPWIYLNSGLWMATPAAALALLESMTLDDLHDDVQAKDDLHGGANRWVNVNDQGWFQVAFALQIAPVNLDYRCALFQSLSGCTPDDFDLSGPRVANKITGSTPGVFHFNGGSKNDLLPMFAQKWGMPL